ncbi:MAG: RidA family protein [Rhodospirillales bacterium]|nr:RidA family protein [Rhodospirillales bacterium]MDE1883939.1 RidA family protein [Rhodospirillales bacterium]MDE2390814.1 RidA family protein [Rhodospirillales bacterium]MDE2459581.1 RidA family protein [Rhodospirillales bacterium]
MSRIIRTETSPVLSKAVEYHGFVYTMGVVAQDTSGDITAQTKDVLNQIDALLEAHGTDNTRLLQAQIWLSDISYREAMNKVWTAWLPEGMAPVRACVEAKLADPAYLVEIMITACR